jgi:hypothetical protein
VAGLLWSEEMMETALWALLRLTEGSLSGVCSSGWLLWVKKKSKPAGRGEDIGSVGCSGGKWGCTG